RHSTLVDVGCMVAREVVAGYYSAEEGFELLDRGWCDVMDDERRRDGPEFANALAWAVGNVLAEVGAAAAHTASSEPPPFDEPTGSATRAPTVDELLPTPLDWHALFAREGTQDWLVEGLWPAGRQLHIFAARKTGKSLVALWIAACLAIGIDP